MGVHSQVELAPGVDVSRETSERLAAYEKLLRRWQSSINLVSARSLATVRERHFADSAQLLPLLPSATRWVDLGSGAGFPGLVIAAQLADRMEGHVDLIESDQKKCAFLRSVARELGLMVTVHQARLEDVLPSLSPVDAICARGLATLRKLVDMSASTLARGAIGVFPKGRTYADELTEINHLANLKIRLERSRTDPDGRIILIETSSQIPPKG